MQNITEIQKCQQQKQTIAVKKKKTGKLSE